MQCVHGAGKYMVSLRNRMYNRCFDPSEIVRGRGLFRISIPFPLRVQTELVQLNLQHPRFLGWVWRRPKPRRPYNRLYKLRLVRYMILVQSIARRRKALLLCHAGHGNALCGRQIGRRLRDHFEPRTPDASAVVVGGALLLRLQDLARIERSQEGVHVY